ncbi:unnamed protein product [Trypanosoma congolense IL3000]|uniref:WGS project CAEQ00000000 data, annotated contig 1744 n=1 Tax=Trypanosoma congolense (strain IL3000) TaxID=1068625 RepID=F9W8L1_TRYCI|nr:unnamed protein product [Trypanosoma congolense IL3000]
MANTTPGVFTLAISEAWEPSLFRPPPVQRRGKLSAKSTLTPMAPPWYPQDADGNDITQGDPQSKQENGPRPMPPPALGQSLTLAPLKEKETPDAPCSSSAVVRIIFSAAQEPGAFTNAATDARVYPLDMFMSASEDAAHTPYGVLRWAIRQYSHISGLKVPLHLQLLVLHDSESSPMNDGVRGAMGACLRVKSRAKPVRLTHHKVLSILSRLTESKYETLLDELKMLPLRQVEDDELHEICKIVHEKAVKEPSYTRLYARLAHDICQVKEGEHENGSCGEGFPRRFRRVLVDLCEMQFHQPLQLSEDDLIDRVSGLPLHQEEFELKRSRLKHRLVGNVRFVAELFKVGVMSEYVVRDIVRILVVDYDPDDPTAKEEHVFELFSTLIRLTAVQLKKSESNLLVRSLGIAKTIELSHPKPRVCFQMMDLEDLNRANKWVPTESVLAHVKVSTKPQKTNTSAPVEAPLSATEWEESNMRSFEGSSVIKPTRRASCCNGSVENAKSLNGRNCNGTDDSGSSSSSSSSSKNNNNINNNGNNNESKDGHDIVIHPTPTTSNSSGKSASVTDIVNQENDKGVLCVTKSSGDLRDTTSNRLFAPPRRVSHNPYYKIFSPSVRDPRQSESKTSNGPSPPTHRSPTSPAASSTDLNLSVSSCGCLRNDRANGLTTVHSELHSPSTGCGRTATERTINMKKITRRLMALFCSGKEEAVAAVLHAVGFKNTVLCLTWWLRLTTTTSEIALADLGRTGKGDKKRALCAELCSKVVLLLSSMLNLRSDEYVVGVIFSTLMEWIRFDMERREYEASPKMFENVAEMFRQCHLPLSDKLPHVKVVRGIMHSGIFNVLLRELVTNGGETPSILNLVKNCHAVSVELAQYLCDPADVREVLGVAAQNRFHPLPYLLGVASTACAGLTEGLMSVELLLPQRCSNPTAEWAPLLDCLLLPSAVGDPGLALFAKMWRCSAGEQDDSPPWRDEAVRVALDAPSSAGSTVRALVTFMAVVGALLLGLSVKCTTASGRSALASREDVCYVLENILKKCSGPLYEAAAVMELVMHHTRSLSGTGECPTFDSARLKSLKKAFDIWCDDGLVGRQGVVELFRSIDNANDKLNLYPAYHNCVADVPWNLVVRVLGGD